MERWKGRKLTVTKPQSYHTTRSANLFTLQLSQQDPNVPRVLNGLVAAVSFLWVQLHQVADEVLGRFRDIVPVRGVKLIVSSHDLLEQFCIVLMVEWGIAT